MDSGMSHTSLTHISVFTVYDNRAYDPHFEAAWGFSCIIDGLEKRIMFDTGGDGAVLLSNLERMKWHPADIDLLVLSHADWDHTGGLFHFLHMNSQIDVLGISSFPREFKEQVSATGARWVEHKEAATVCTNAYTTGEMFAYRNEQGLIIRMPAGAVLITGCAHPGIVPMLQHTRALQGDILMAMGGFHLGRSSQTEIQQIIHAFRQEQVRYAAPCHCTGERAIQAFEADYQDHFLRIGAGRVLHLDDLS